MKYFSTLITTLFMTAFASVASAQSGDDCYPGLGLCEDAVTAQTPLPMRMDIGTWGDEPAPGQQGSQTTQQQPTQQPAPTNNPICIVYDVRPPDAWLALRTEPSTKRGTRLYKLPSGTAIEMLGQRSGNWYLVRVYDGSIGWVSWYKKRWIAC